MKSVREIIAYTLRISQSDLSEKTKFEEIDTWDSLTHMELIANLEEALSIIFSSGEIVEMTSVDTIEKTVEGKMLW